MNKTFLNLKGFVWFASSNSTITPVQKLNRLYINIILRQGKSIMK